MGFRFSFLKAAFKLCHLPPKIEKDNGFPRPTASIMQDCCLDYASIRAAARSLHAATLGDLGHCFGKKNAENSGQNRLTVDSQEFLNKQENE